MYAAFLLLNFARTKGLSLNERPPLWSAMLLETLQSCRGLLGPGPSTRCCVASVRRGREQGHGREKSVELFLAEHALLDGQRVAQHGLCLGKLALGLQRHRKVACRN